MLSQYWRQKKYEGYFLEDAYLWCDGICMPSSLQTYEKLLTRQWSGIFLILQSLDIQPLPHTDSALSSLALWWLWNRISMFSGVLKKSVHMVFFLSSTFTLVRIFRWEHHFLVLIKCCVSMLMKLPRWEINETMPLFLLSHELSGAEVSLETNVSFSLHQNFFCNSG